MRPCPVCDCVETRSSVRRTGIPVIQNRVYSTRAEAACSPMGSLTLQTCLGCGFSFNGDFDPRPVAYDATYDNDVPSEVFRRYYEGLATRIIARFGLSGGTVYDIGCGKGTFLKVLCRLAPGIQGVGVDPSCTPMTSGNVTMIRDVFRPGLIAPDARLVLLRHVLEHIDQPVTFLGQLALAAPDAPLYVEVPDLDWIFEHGTFWDFCYEHCNYFTQGALAQALVRAGYRVGERWSLFSGQFQGAVCTQGRAERLLLVPSACEAVARAQTYATSESRRLSAAREQVELTGGRAVLWGMATKGVMFASLLGGHRFSGGVDINSKKQHRFAPGSGLAIYPPEWLTSLEWPPTIFVMNANYAGEIRRAVADLGVSARYVDL